MQWSSAASSAPDLDRAMDMLADELKPAPGDGPADLAVVFVSPHHQEAYGRIPELVEEHFGPCALIGCSAAGVIGGGRELEQQPALSLSLASLPGVEIHPFHLSYGSLPDPDAGPQQWVELLGVAPQPAAHFLLLADPATFDPRPLLMGLDFAYPHGAKIGGLASAYENNALFLGGAVLDAGAIGLALQGNLAVDTVVAQGCRPIGQPMTITLCRENLLLELDHRPSVEVLLELYHHLSPEDQELLNRALHLGIASSELQEEFGHGDFLIRNIERIGRDPDFIAIGDHLRQGQTVQFHLRDAHTAADDLDLMLRRYRTHPAPTPLAGALLFTCTGRGEYLYEKPNHDSDMFLQQMGDIPLAGFSRPSAWHWHWPVWCSCWRCGCRRLPDKTTRGRPHPGGHLRRPLRLLSGDGAPGQARRAVQIKVTPGVIELRSSSKGFGVAGERSCLHDDEKQPRPHAEVRPRFGGHTPESIAYKFGQNEQPEPGSQQNGDLGCEDGHGNVDEQHQRRRLGKQPQQDQRPC